MDFEFTETIWKYGGKSSWYFISLPKDFSLAIKDNTQQKRGFGSVKVKAKIGSTTWKTSIFPDTKRKTYILPIKKSVRQANNLDDGDSTIVHLSIIDF